MPGSVKNRIRSGTIFLFLLVVISGGFSIYYLVNLRAKTRNILKANYESLVFSREMQKSLDSILTGRSSNTAYFEYNLQHQENNITEPGETEATSELRSSFQKLKSGDTSAGETIKRNLFEILTLNLQAIKNKNENTERSAEEAKTFLITIVSFVFIIGFVFALNFPSIITNPIRKLTNAIREIGQKNYSHRIHIESKDEFGQLADAFNEMAERLEYFENSNLNKLIFEKSRAEAVINSLKDASIGIDKNNKVLFANNQALQLLGMDAKSIVGHPAEDVTKQNDLFRFLLEEKGTTPFKIVLDNRENYFTKEIIDVPQDDSSSRVLVLRNITTFKELDTAKTNFIATVSHELKTPLASSDFSLKLLEDNRVGTLTDEQNELVQHLRNDNQRMLKILSELLNMSQVEAGKIQLNMQIVDPSQVIESSINAVSATAKEKGIKINKEFENNQQKVNMDPDKISWVLNNFLTNAIRYSPANSTVQLRVEKKLPKYVTFSVTDSGQGIEEMYLNRIFERYFQIPGRSDKKGSGIGLAICKEFIEAMGGKIWVKSRLGEGSSFGFDLPANEIEKHV